MIDAFGLSGTTIRLAVRDGLRDSLSSYRIPVYNTRELANHNACSSCGIRPSRPELKILYVHLLTRRLMFPMILTTWTAAMALTWAGLLDIIS
jgi:hypothetical protein